MKLLPIVACLGLGCTDDHALGSVEQGVAGEPGDDGTGGGCPVWGCGGNTSKMHGIPFIEAHELGDFNSDGWKIVRFEKQVGATWQAFRADVQSAELLARDLTTGQVVYQGSQLKGSRFEMYSSTTKLFYYLSIYEVAEMEMWGQPDPANPRLTNTYRMKWVYKPGQELPAMHPEDICGANPDGPDGGGVMADFQAVLFEDDRIDPDQIQVYAQTRDWFNIGCAGHALAKQHLLGYTHAAAAILAVPPTTLAERTAVLKMITADYCGNGHPFTVPGQRLLWIDKPRWYDTVSGQYGVIEARWTEAGATCLNVPRVDYHWTYLGSQTFPDGVAALLPPKSTQWCATLPPPCTGDKTDVQNAYFVSVNY